MKAKKRFGQHFLKNLDVAKRIADSVTYVEPGRKVYLLEIGPGTGVLTQFLVQKQEYELYLVEIDREAQEILVKRFPQLSERLIRGDFLKLDLSEYFTGSLVVVGNIPYNITGPIMFKVLDYRDLVRQCVFMVQREVAHRIVAGPGSKEYGILSVMLQSYYRVEYLFGVSSGSFYPRPRVESAVVRLTREERGADELDYNFFRYIVKTAFNQRRKTLKNALGKLYDLSEVPEEYLDKRAEQLSLEQFWELARKIK